jgi:hypothetical protein
MNQLINQLINQPRQMNQSGDFWIKPSEIQPSFAGIHLVALHSLAPIATARLQERTSMG